MKRMLRIATGLWTCAFLALAFTGTVNAQFDTVWQQSVAETTLPTYFGADTERGGAFGKLGDDEYVFVVSRNAGIFVRYVNPTTGELVGTLPSTGVAGGTFPINDGGATEDGVFIAGNLTINLTTSAFKAYAWTSTTGDPVNIINYAGGAEALRLGDKITVTGSVANGTAKIWAASGSVAGRVAVWGMADGAWVNEPTIITLSDNAFGASAGVGVLPNGDFYWSSGGNALKKYSATGSLLGSVPTTVIATGSNVSKYLKTIDNIDYVAVFQFGAGNNNARIVAVNTADFATSTSYGVTPTFGSAANINGAGDVDVRDNGDGSFTLAVLATNNGLGVFTTNAAPLQAVVAPPTLLLAEYFEYGVGALLSANGYTAHSGAGTNPITVVDQTLEFAGYTGSAQGKAVAMTTSEDVNRPLDGTVEEGSFYASFLVNVSAASTGGDYFFHFSTNPQSTFYGRTYAKIDANNKLAFGIGGNGAGVYTEHSYDLNTTYLVVVKYEFIADAPDLASITVNPVGSEEPATWLAESAPSSDIASIGTVALRQASGNAATLVLGGLRAGVNYAEVVGNPEAPVLPPAPSNYAASLSGLHENPAVISDGSGTMSAVLTGTQLVVTGQFSGLTGNYTMSHIHGGANGANGGVAFALTPQVGGDSKSGTYLAEANTFTLDETQIGNLAAGNWYVNIHSETSPGGEIRGQLVASPNAAPMVSDLTAPAANAEITISGFSGTAFTPTWTTSTDADDNSLVYIWQLMTTTNEVLLQGKTSGTSITYTYAQVDALLETAGVTVGNSIGLKHRVVVSDGSALAFGDEFPVTLVRGTLSNMVTIAEAYALPVNTTGVTIEAIVTRVRGREGRIQDDTGAFSLFLGSTGTYFDMVADGSVRSGDSIRITGRRAAFNGLNQLDQISELVVINRDNALPEAQLVTLADIRDNGAQYESALVRVVGLTVNPAGDELWSGGTSGRTYRITDATVTEEAIVDFRVPNPVNTNLVGDPIPTGEFVFQGVLGRFNATFQLYAVEKTDVEFTPPPMAGIYTIPRVGEGPGFPTLSAAVAAFNMRGASDQVSFLITSDLVDTNAVIRIDRSDLTEETPLMIMPASVEPVKVDIRQILVYATPHVYILGNNAFSLDDEAFSADEMRKAVSESTDMDNLNTAIFEDLTELGPRHLTFNIATAAAPSSAIYLQGTVTDSYVFSINVTMSGSQGLGIPAFILNRVDGAVPGQGGLSNVVIGNVQIGSADAPVKFKDGFWVFGSSSGAFPLEGIVLMYNDIHVGHRGLSTQIIRDNIFFGNRIWVYGKSDQSAHIGMNINTPVGQLVIANNRFLRFQTNRSTATDMIGINLTNSLNDNGVFIYNNYLAMNHSKAEGVTGELDRVLGIAHSGTASIANIHVFHNTIHIPVTSQTGKHAALAINGGSVNTPFMVYNNLLINRQPDGFAIDWNGTSLNADYNNLRASVLLRNGAESYTTLNALKATGMYENTVSRQVSFVSNTNLDLAGSSLGDAMLMGESFGDSFEDINGRFRSPIAPYMGAFEGPAFTVTATKFELLSPDTGTTLVLTNDAEQDVVITWEESYSTVAFGNQQFSLLNDEFAHGGEGNNALGKYIGSSMNSEATLTTPVLQNAGELSFWMSTFSNATVLTVVAEGTTDGETWDELQTYSAVDGGTGDINVNWQLKTIALDEPIAMVRFRVMGTDGAAIAGAVYFDDFSATTYDGSEGMSFDQDFESWTEFVTLTYTWHLQTANGNFNTPKLSIQSDNNGQSPMLTLSHPQVEQAMADIGVFAGLAFTGKWTVTAEVGTSNVFARESHALTIQRYVDVSVDEREAPLVFALGQNYPNPFNPNTAIEYSIAETANVTLTVYTITGQEVMTLVNEVKSPGVYNVSFDASRLSSGVYIYRIVAGGFTQTQKMTLIK